MTNFQRINSISNAHVGRDFEEIALAYFLQQNIRLNKNVVVQVGVYQKKKNRVFDLGSLAENSTKVLVECKSHKWTVSGKVPSAKMTVWNEAMYYFLLVPKGYRKIFFILRDYHDKRGETLGEYYIRVHGHLIPEDVEIMEYDIRNNQVRLLHSKSIDD